MVENMAISSSKDDKPEPCVFVSDPTNPRIVYATLWEAYRKRSSGGKGSGMYKSIDGGDTWKSLNENQEQLSSGKMGIAVSPVNSIACML
jgi:hypothetical protein